MSVTVRERVFGFVHRYPGAHPRAIERALGLSDRLAAHHLGTLVAEGRVHRFHEGGFVRYVDAARAARLDAEERQFLALVRRPPALRILVLLAAEGELTQGDITRRLGLAKASTSYHLRALLEAGVARVREESRHRHYSLAQPTRTRELLAEFGALPGDLDAFSRMWDDLFSA